MLKGHVFNLQTFTSEAFALFIDKFLNGRCGVAKGCELSNTNNSVTIADGFFVVRGRFLEVISGVTVSNITSNGFYSLICEIDLSKTNTADQLNQATIKVISGASAYPTLTQQDITGTGTVYQYEFARFKVESGSITNFTDKRTFVDFTTIYDVIQNEAQGVLDDIEQALQNVLDGSAYLLKTGGTISGNLKVTGNITGSLTGTASNSQKLGGKDANDYKLKGDFAVLTGSFEVAISSSGTKEFDYPSGYTVDNCVAVSFGIKVIENKGYNYEGIYTDSGDALNNSYRRRLNLNSNKIKMVVYNPNSDKAMTVNYKLVLMKIS